MGALIVSILGGLLRYLLAGAVTWMITNGIATEEQTTQLIAGLTSGIALVAWLVWVKYKDRVKLVSGLAAPKGTTIDELNGLIASGQSAAATTPNDAVPVSSKATGSVKPRAGAILLPLLLAGALTSGACSLVSPPAVVNPAPTEEQIQVVRNQAAKLAVATKEAATIAVEARRLAESAFNAGAISRDAMLAINQLAIDVSGKGQSFVTFAETVTTEPSLRATAEALHQLFDDYIRELMAVGGITAEKAQAIRSAIAVLSLYITGGDQ